MDIIKRINMMVESKLRGFKNRKALAMEIEDMEWKVEKKDSLKFQLILNKYLVDQDITLSVIEAVLKLKDRQIVALYDELLDLHYDD
jgi:hypothetical protein